MRQKLITLANTIHWDAKEGDKVYLRNVQVSIADLPFATRQVLLRFAGGPSLDFCLVDMDRVALEYLMLRGVKPPAHLCRLAKAKPPPAADFVVPNHIMADLPRGPKSRR